MNNYHLIYEAERSKTTRELREADIRAGELAAEFARLWHALRDGLRGGLRRGTVAHASAAVAGDAGVAGDAAVGELELGDPGLDAGDEARHLTSLCN